ncbi:MAG: ribosomal L7Ae/L30e/S12e/Gadd45 family protein [Clostridia bacterium]|nr:ribosomal L7Ae/L30e/S12e/Gadd45 family protein [Clostridia bacterium]
MKDKILTLLGFASKAGKLSYGFDKTLLSLKSKKSFLIIVSSDVSEKSKKEISFYAKKHKTKVLFSDLFDTEELTKAVGRVCATVSVNDNSFADAIIGLGGNA